MKKNVSFFGGAIRDTTTKEYQESVLIGDFLAKARYNVICGGYGGLMEAVSKGAKEAGGYIHGVTCASFGNGSGNQYLSRETRTLDIFARLKILIDDVEFFVVQKGGVGTLAELFLAWDINRKLKEPAQFYLIGDHWHDILTAIEPVVSRKEEKYITICSDFSAFEKAFIDGRE